MTVKGMERKKVAEVSLNPDSTPRKRDLFAIQKVYSNGNGAKSHGRRVAGGLATVITLTGLAGETVLAQNIDSLSVKPKKEIVQSGKPFDYSKLLTQLDSGKIAKNETATSPAPNLAPKTGTYELNAFPIIGGTKFEIGRVKDGKLDDSQPASFDATDQLKKLGLSAFPANSEGLYIQGEKNSPYLARFYIVMPGVCGIIGLDMISIYGMSSGESRVRGILSDSHFDEMEQWLAKVGITSSSKIGRDYTEEIGYDSRKKVIVYELTKDSTVLMYGFNVITQGHGSIKPQNNPNETNSVGQK